MTERGWTLTELLTVIAIWAVLAGLGGWGVKAWIERVQFEQVERLIALDLEWARQHSVAEQRRYQVSFLPDLGRYIIFADRDRDEISEVAVRTRTLPGSVWWGTRPGLLGPPANPTRPPDPDGITFLENRVAFRYDGGGPIATPGTVYLVSRRTEDVRAVSLDLLGFVRAYRWDGRRWR